MFRKLQLLLLLFVCASTYTYAQQGTGIVKGHLVNKATKEVATEVQLSFPALKLVSISNGQGDFRFSQVPYGTHTMYIGGQSILLDSMQVTINAGVVDLGTLQVTSNDANTSLQTFDIPTIAIEEGNSNDDDMSSSSQSVSGLLTGSRDPFLNTAAFVFGPYRFRPRGYENNQQEIYINGLQMNDIETGNAFWNQWGGLNDVFRSRVNTYGLATSDYGFGSVGGLVYFDATAASQRKQTRVTYSLTNRTYRNRLMLTHSTGLNKNGWAYSASVSKRWANEGYFEGTFYDGYSYYAAVSKQLKGGKHQFNLTAFGAPTTRGKSNAVFDESTVLTGNTHYNPNWGYQDGEKRNGRVANTFQPAFILNYEYHPSNNLRWNTAFGYQFGKNADARIDWYNGRDIRPDYYKYLPSYYQLPYNNNPQAVEEMRAWYAANPEALQINWDRIYEANRMNVETMPNSTETGSRSIYVIGNDVENMKKYNFNTNLEYAVNEHLKIYTGANFINQSTECYRELTDLLGGDYFLNYNQFAAREFSGNASVNQNDLNNPDAVVKVGDKYSYDYILRYTKAWWWGQALFNYNKFDFFVAARAGYSGFSREGLYRNGLFPNASFGRSGTHDFVTYGAKAGVTYKLNGRNYLFVNGAYAADAPTPDNAYVNIRTRDFTVANPTVLKIQSLEGGYLMKAPTMNARVVGYVTDMKDGLDLKRYYSDNLDGFVTYSLTNVNTRSIGMELALNVKVSSTLEITGVAALGQSFYTNRPTAATYRDNDTIFSSAVNQTLYIENYYTGVGPQQAYNLGLNYRSPKYWYANLNFNYFDGNYIDMAPNRRTTEAIGLATPGTEMWNDILGQEKLPAFFTADLFFGKSFMLSKIIKGLPRSAFLYLNVGVNNLLNNKNIKTGGFEQLRFDYGAVDKFPNKYFYGFGRNYFINLSLKF